MNNRKDLYRMISQVDDVHSALVEAVDAMCILDEFMEADGYMPKDGFEEWKAINFAKRFPLYLNTFRVILRDLTKETDELYTAINTLYASIGVKN